MKIIIRILAVVGASLTVLATAGGISAAKGDPLIGLTYKAASAKVAEWGGDTQISTVVGSRLKSDDCLVQTWQKSHFTDSSGNKRKTVFLMNLNCNGSVASAGTPGASAASPEGRQAARDITVGQWCAKSEQADNENCTNFCSSHDGLCTAA